MNVGSLFSGIGGLDLGLERAGMNVIWQSEIDPYASKVLAKHWPDVPNLGDITTIDWSTVERPDVICGGYPCQPFSLAGVRQGEADPRHLWPHFAAAIRHLRPRHALLENVPGHLSLGFGRVLGDLADLGYDCEWDCIPAAAVGAPHLRYRVFVVAHTDLADGETRGGHRVGAGTRPVDRQPARPRSQVPDAAGRGRTGRTDRPGVRRDAGEWGEAGQDPGDVRPVLANTACLAEREPADNAIAITTRREARTFTGCGSWWAVEPDVGRVADGVPARVDRLRTLGNAVVPAVAQLIGEAIMEVAAA